MQIAGWYCGIMVDGVGVRILGVPIAPPIAAANETAVEFTPTRTSFIMQAGNVTVNATYFSPIQVRDLFIYKFWLHVGLCC